MQTAGHNLLWWMFYIFLIYCFITLHDYVIIFMATPRWLAVGPSYSLGGLFINFKICVFLIIQLLWFMRSLGSNKPVESC